MPDKPILDYAALSARGMRRPAAIALISGTIVVAGVLYVLGAMMTTVRGQSISTGARWTTGPTAPPGGTPAPGYAVPADGAANEP